MGMAMLTYSTRCVYMIDLKFREMRVQGTWLSGFKGRWSYISREVVLSNDGKKRSRRRLDAIFKGFGKALKWIMKYIIVRVIAKLVSFLVNNFIF